MKKWFIFCLFLLLPALTFAAGEKEEGAVAMDEEVEIFVKLPSNPPGALSEITEALNEMTKRDLNATVRFEHYTWSDWRNKYKLDLVSGEPIDMLYSAKWIGFFEFQADGAFKDISGMLPQYAPRVWENVEEDKWVRLTRANDAIYAVPAHWNAADANGFVYREDLRKKYNVPEITNVDAFEQYLTAIKKNEPDMKPMGNGKIADDNYLPMVPHHEDIIDSHILYDVRSPDKDLTTPLDHRDSIIEWAERNRDFYDKDFFTHDILANEGSARIAETDFRNGSIGIAFSNSGGYQNIKNELETEKEDWEIGFVPGPHLNAGRYALFKGVTQDLTVFPLAGEDTPRALQLLDKLLFDQEYYNLVNYGIEGSHYKKVNENTIELIVGNGFGPQALAFWSIRNDDLEMTFDESYDSAGAKLREELALDAYPDYGADFYIDETASVKPILAALGVVKDEHYIPLSVGLYSKSEIPGKVDAYLKALENAGVKKLRDFVQPYWDMYIAQE
ncbi:MAG: extracellular solute-binding protein [Spirochaetia bacterium]